MDLSKVGERERLRARREPHWQRLRNGCFLGFRPSKRGGAGTWIARAYDEDKSRYKMKSLGDYGSLPPRDRFQAAKSDAEAFAELVFSGGEVMRSIETVGDACEAYAEEKPDAKGRFERHVYGDPIAKVKLDKLRRRHLKEWRERLEKRPAMVSRAKRGKKLTRVRAPSSINRDMVPLRAALFKILPPGPPASEAAWQEALAPIRNADRQRTLYLDREQRRILSEAVGEEARPFITALCLLPLRPGAMAALSTGDYEPRTRELTVGEDKSGRPRRITVPEKAAALLNEARKDKLPAAPLFTRLGGARWSKECWNQPIAEALEKTDLPSGVTAYTLRHSVLTDLVDAGLPILTVAQISDTSVEMIERHYGHLNSAAAERALAEVSI